jgi:hypothetical protein
MMEEGWREKASGGISPLPPEKRTHEHERNMALKTDQPGLNPEISSERRAAIQVSL